MKATATAQVTVKLQVSVGTWGMDCPMSQVVDQAKAEAIGKVRNLLPKGEGIHLVGDPHVTAFIAVQDDS